MVLLLFIIIYILLIILIIILPLELATRLNLLIVGTGVIITAYGLYRAVQLENMTNIQKIKDDNDKYYGHIYEMFSSDKELEEMYYQIYGKSDVSPKEFSMFSIMIEAIQNVAMSYNYDNIPQYWYNTWNKWLSHPDFKKFWSISSDEFNPKTVNIITHILKKLN